MLPSTSSLQRLEQRDKEMATETDLIEMIQGIQLCLNPPEWMKQHMLIERGDAKWSDFSVEEKTCKGWLWPYLLQIDSLPKLVDTPEGMVMDYGKTPVHLRGGSGRWRWWMEAHALGRLPDSPIPQINFLGMHDPETLRMLEKCLDADWSYRLDHFLDWLLWGFGEGEERPKISEKTNEKWYGLFNMGLMIVNPYDYWGYLYSETKGRGSWNRSGFYPTPQHVVQLMCKMVMADHERENDHIDHRLDSMCEPCCGTGRMLMEQSNYSVNMYGMDIDHICVAATKVNGYLYIPWLVRPARWINELRAASDTEHKEETIEETISRIIKEVDPEYQIELDATQKTGVHRFKIKSGPSKGTFFKVKDLTPEKFRAKYQKAIEKAAASKVKSLPNTQPEQMSLW